MTATSTKQIDLLRKYDSSVGHVKMRGRLSNYVHGDFAILRVNGSRLGRPNPPRYCYEFHFKGKLLKQFEYQREALEYRNRIVHEYRVIMSRREKEEESFIKKYDLPSFPRAG